MPACVHLFVRRRGRKETVDVGGSNFKWSAEDLGKCKYEVCMCVGKRCRVFSSSRKLIDVDVELFFFSPTPRESNFIQILSREQETRAQMHLHVWKTRMQIGDRLLTTHCAGDDLRVGQSCGRLRSQQTDGAGCVCVVICVTGSSAVKDCYRCC